MTFTTPNNRRVLTLLLMVAVAIAGLSGCRVERKTSSTPPTAPAQTAPSEPPAGTELSVLTDVSTQLKQAGFPLIGDVTVEAGSKAGATGEFRFAGCQTVTLSVNTDGPVPTVFYDGLPHTKPPKDATSSWSLCEEKLGSSLAKRIEKQGFEVIGTPSRNVIGLPITFASIQFAGCDRPTRVTVTYAETGPVKVRPLSKQNVPTFTAPPKDTKTLKSLCGN